MVPHRYLTGPPVPSAMFVGAQLRITPGWDHRRRNPPELQQQALMNLMLNGIEAMPDTTGELSIKSQLQEDGDVLISVSDTGEA
jgi:hypothetical protein